MLELFDPVFHAAQDLVTYLGANPILLAILTLLAAPYVDKFLVRRKGVIYWTINDARVGVIPETLPEGNLGGAEGLRRFVRMLERMSKVDIRATVPNGSVNGVRDVSNDHVAVTDGKQNTTQPGLPQKPWPLWCTT
jgi:hypothetical protein